MRGYELGREWMLAHPSEAQCDESCLSSMRMNKVALIFFTMSLMASLISCLWIGYGDDYRENLTLEEAQDLVSFPICIPTYLPPGVDPKPQIIYESDAANVPEETYIRLRYKGKNDRKKVFETYQVYTNDKVLKTNYPDSELSNLYDGAKVSLLYWTLPGFQVTSEKIDEAVSETQVEAKAYQTDQIVWWLYEIVAPSEYRSTMTEWIKDQVKYRILSYLPVEEIEKVTVSMLDCSPR